jgi:hypothetical protein
VLVSLPECEGGPFWLFAVLPEEPVLATSRTSRCPLLSPRRLMPVASLTLSVTVAHERVVAGAAVHRDAPGLATMRSSPPPPLRVSAIAAARVVAR